MVAFAVTTRSTTVVVGQRSQAFGVGQFTHCGAHPRDAAHSRAAHRSTRFDVNGGGFAVVVRDGEDVDFGQIDEAFAHADMVCFHGGSANCGS